MNFWSKFFRDLFTGKDNKTYEMGRLLWFQSVQAFVLVTCYALYKGGQFDPITWGAGMAALIAGGGAGIKLKADTEPNHEQDDYMDAVLSAKRKGDRYKQKTVVSQETTVDSVDPTEGEGCPEETDPDSVVEDRVRR